MNITRDAAWELLKKYNKEAFHLQHGLTVEGIMKWYADSLGYQEDADFWAIAGLLHDVDFEAYPEEHCTKAPELLAEIQAEEPLIHAVCSHGWGMTPTSAKPEHEMEKVLFAVDELSGLIGAAARMRPSKSVSDMEVSSLKKKFKDKKFAAGCSRDVICQGADLLVRFSMLMPLSEINVAIWVSMDGTFRWISVIRISPLRGMDTEGRLTEF